MSLRPHQYGFRTVRTGNEKHLSSTPRQRKLAKKWGNAHGFKGQQGGWIYTESGQHIAHGWGQFYHRRATAIELWARAQERINDA